MGILQRRLTIDGPCFVLKPGGSTHRAFSPWSLVVPVTQRQSYRGTPSLYDQWDPLGAQHGIAANERRKQAPQTPVTPNPIIQQ